MPRALRGKKLECCICTIEKKSFEFPHKTPSDTCEHPVNTCTECVDTWLEISLRDGYQPTLRCPECSETIVAQADLQTEPHVHRHYIRLYTRITKSMTPNWRWCLNPRCRSGQIHLPVEQDPNSPNGVEPDIFLCDKCTHFDCVVCDRPFHEDMTCEEFAESSMARMVEDKLSERVIERMYEEGQIKECANCSCPIEKEGKGRMVYCTRCLHTFDWDKA